MQQDKLKNQLVQLHSSQTVPHLEQKFHSYLDTWNNMSLEQKKAITRLFIHEIKIWNDKIEIHYLTENDP